MQKARLPIAPGAVGVHLPPPLLDIEGLKMDDSERTDANAAIAGTDQKQVAAASIAAMLAALRDLQLNVAAIHEHNRELLAWAMLFGGAMSAMAGAMREHVEPHIVARIDRVVEAYFETRRAELGLPQDEETING